MVVNGEPNVILLYKLFNTRERLWRGVSYNNDLDAGTFAIVELAANIVVFILAKIDRTSGM
jgi:hypothetical protein